MVEWMKSGRNEVDDYDDNKHEIETEKLFLLGSWGNNVDDLWCVTFDFIELTFTPFHIKYLMQYWIFHSHEGHRITNLFITSCYCMQKYLSLSGTHDKFSNKPDCLVHKMMFDILLTRHKKRVWFFRKINLWSCLYFMNVIVNVWKAAIFCLKLLIPMKMLFNIQHRMEIQFWFACSAVQHKWTFHMNEDIQGFIHE